MANLSTIFPTGSGGAGGLEPVFYTATTGPLTPENNKYYLITMDADLTVNVGDISTALNFKLGFYDGDDQYKITVDVDASDQLIINGNPQTAGDDLTIQTLGGWAQLIADPNNNFWYVEAAAVGGDYASASVDNAGVGRKIAWVEYQRTGSNLALSNGLFADLIYNTLIEDGGLTGYDNTTGVFTVPDTGLYLFDVSANCSGAGFTTCTPQLTDISNTEYATAGSTGELPRFWNRFLYLTAGEQVKARFRINAGSPTMVPSVNSRIVITRLVV